MKQSEFIELGNNGNGLGIDQLPLSLRAFDIQTDYQCPILSDPHYEEYRLKIGTLFLTNGSGSSETAQANSFESENKC